MFYSLTRILGAPAIMSWLCLPAAAAELAPESHDAVYYELRVLLITISLIIGAYYAHGAFERPIVTPEDGPAPPRYMTQPRQYRMGMIAYMGLCLVAYALIVGYYKDLAPFLELAAPPEIRPAVDAAINQSALSFPVVVVLAVVALAAFLKIEREWNPLFALRRVVWGWVSIPELANHIMSAALSGLVVPPNERENIAREPGNHVDSGDFDKDRQSVDRNWAELCYLRLWLTRNREAGSHFTFFNEPSLGWHDLENDYKKMRDQIAPLKQALRPDSGFGAEIFAETATKIEKLRRRYCRLAACFIVFKTDTKKAAVRDAERFGATFAGPIEARRNPMRYVVLFVVAILISINLGVWLSATMWDLTHPAAAASAAASALDKDANITTRWVYYSLATFGAPIFVVLMLRYLGWSYDAEQPASYTTSYAAIFVIALCVSVSSLALATELSHGLHPDKPFVDLLFMDFKWGWSPALICLYVVYHVDLQIDPLLPDIGAVGGEGVAPRLIACVLFGVLVTLFSLLPTASITPRPDSAWPVEKLHTVVTGTIFMIGIVMALVSQFCLVKSAKPGTQSGPGINRALPHSS